MGFVESPTSLIRVKNEKRGGKKKRNREELSSSWEGWRGGGERGGSGEAAMAPCARTQKKREGGRRVSGFFSFW